MFILTPFVASLFVSTIVTIVVAYISWQKKTTKTGMYFALGMVALTIWSLASALDYAVFSLSLKIVFAKIEALGYLGAISLFTLTSISFAGNDIWLEKKWFKALFVLIPTSNILLVWTNELHGMIWTGFERKANNVVVFNHGPAFDWVVITTYSFIILIFVNLWMAFRQGSSFVRRQALWLALALLFPIITNTMYQFRVGGVEGVDWTSVTFSVSGVIFLYALYGTRFLDIIPIARDKLFNNLSDGMIVLDTQNRIVDINQPAMSALNIPLDSLIGKNLAGVIPFFHALLEQDIEQEIKSEFEIGNEIKRYFEVRVSPLREGRKILIGRLVFLRDITIRKEAESQRNTALKALEESRQAAEDIFEFTPNALLTVDEDGVITRVNKQAQVLFGYARDELLGKKIDMLIPKRFQSNHARNLTGFFAEPHYRAMGTGLELFALTRNGHEFFVDILLSPLQLNGRTFVTISVRDITDRVQAEAALHEAQAAIVAREQAMAAEKEREYLARDLHDGVVQALGYISMQIEHAQSMLREKNYAGAEQMLSNLADATRRTNRDAREYILTLKEGAQAPIQEGFFFALREYCQNIEQEYQFGIHLFLPDTLPDVLASAKVETQLTYIIREALQNARKHSGVSEASLTIEVDDKFVQTVVEDAGIGWNRMERPQRGHFGLSLMRARAEEVGGSLEIKTSPTRGTRITARLPRKLAEENLSRIRTLLADDHPLIIEGVRAMLTLHGANVIGVAKDGSEALEMARALKPDLVLMDINMPRMNGLDAVRNIKAEMPDTKIIMLTSSLDEDNLFAALHAGAIGYLLKGMTGDEFMTLLAETAYGEANFSSEVAAKMLKIFTRPELQVSPTQPRNQLVRLSETQQSILNLVAEGLTYKEIGQRMFLTERTVKYHMGEILKRLHLKGRREAAEYMEHKKKD